MAFLNFRLKISCSWATLLLAMYNKLLVTAKCHEKNQHERNPKYPKVGSVIRYYQPHSTKIYVEGPLQVAVKEPSR